MLGTVNAMLESLDNFIWGLPLIVLILATGILLTVRLRGLQIRHLGKALRYIFHNEEDGEGEVTSFGALCTALYRWVRNSDRCRWSRSDVLDVDRRFVRNGHEVHRRYACSKISAD